MVLAILLFVAAVPLLADSLWVSNYPEEVAEPGIVQDRVISNDAVRMLYYHKNVAKTQLRWGLWVQNVGTATSNFQYFMGVGGPVDDGVFAGHVATREYMSARVRKQVNEIVLGPGERVQVMNQPIKPSMIVSGVVSMMAPTAGARFRVQMALVDPAMPLVSLLNDCKKAQIHTAEFPKITDKQSIQFFTRDNAKILPIGDTPFLKDRRTNFELQGNYGLINDYTIQITNNLPVHSVFEMVFSSAGGVCRGVLVINGGVVETGLFKPPDLNPQQIYRQVLQPNQTITMSVSIMPQAGSNYPASLVLKAEPALQLKGGSV